MKISLGNKFQVNHFVLHYGKTQHFFYDSIVLVDNYDIYDFDTYLSIVDSYLRLSIQRKHLFNPYYLPLILKVPRVAADFCNLVNSRVPEAEDAILCCDWSSLSYCKKNIQGRWDRFEQKILAGKVSIYYIVDYCRNVLMARFLEWEKSLTYIRRDINNHEGLIDYYKYFFQGRNCEKQFPKVMLNHILSSTYYATLFAIVSGRRLPASIEKKIAQDEDKWNSYCYNLKIDADKENKWKQRKKFYNMHNRNKY